MANRFTQATQSQYIPTIAPPNSQMYTQAADIMQKRHEQGMKQYDALQESLNQLDVLASDKELLKQKRDEIENKLGQFADENDFIDAMPAIRREARNLTKEMQEGPIADALENKAQAEEVFTKIEDSDWSPQMKESMKEYYLQDYQNAKESGRLGSWSPPEYVDIEGELDDMVKGINETTEDKFKYVPDGDGGFVKAKVKTSGRDPNQVNQAIAEKIYGDPKTNNALRMKAKMRGRDPDEYLKEEALRYSKIMNTRHVDQDVTFSGVDTDGMTGVSSTTMGRRTKQPGVIQSTSMLNGDVDDHISDMVTAAQSGNDEKYRMMEDGLNNTFAQAMEAGKVTQDDYEYLMEKLQTEGPKMGFGIRDALGLAEDAVGSVSGNRPYLGGEEPQDERFLDIISRLDEYTENAGGVVGTTFPFTNEEVKSDVEYAFQNASPQAFDVINQELVQDMSEKEKQDFIQNAIVNGKPRGVMTAGDSRAPYYRLTVPIEEDGETKEKEVFLKEKATSNMSREGDSMFERIMGTAFGNDPAAQQLKDHYRLYNLPETGTDVYGRLPAEYKADMGDMQYVSLIQTENKKDRKNHPNQTGGTILELGESEDTKRTVKAKDILESAMSRFETLAQDPRRRNSPETRQNFSRIKQMVESSDTLRETEKNAILDNLYELNLREMPADAINKLRKEYDKPYEFSNKITATNFARTVGKGQKQKQQR